MIEEIVNIGHLSKVACNTLYPPLLLTPFAITTRELAFLISIPLTC